MDPLSIVTGTMGLIGSAVSMAIQIMKAYKELKNVPEAARVFMGILEQINCDIDYAGHCYTETEEEEGEGGDEKEEESSSSSPARRLWIRTVLQTAIAEVAGFGALVDSVDRPTLRERVRFVLEDYRQLGDREKALRFAHSRLLAALDAMHLLKRLGPSGRRRRSRARAAPAPPRIRAPASEPPVAGAKEN
ncbi:hypothetical protein GGR52DRAFT_591064 [Hypoxylon sp. FL1284]|nr:hypothetical protein GGR52DRAFT_591064 [Hypoxylon sp. FL1284]